MFPLSGALSNANFQGSVASSKGTQITANATANTKGNYTQLVASTPYDAKGFILQIVNGSVATGYLVDIAIGAAGSEVDLLSNIDYGPGPSGASGIQIHVPCEIPAGTRIAARCQSGTGSATVFVSLILFDGDWNFETPLGAPVTYGSLTASSKGTLVDPGTPANTKAAYSEIVASTTYDIGALQVIFDDQAVASAAAQWWLVDIAVGAAGSEVVIIPNILFWSNSAAILVLASPPLFRVHIPAGTRLAARAQGTNNTSGTRKFGISLLGYRL